MRRTTCSTRDAIRLVDGRVLVGEVKGCSAVYIRRPGRHGGQQVGPLERGRGTRWQVCPVKGGSSRVTGSATCADQDLSPVCVVAGVDEPPARVARQAGVAVPVGAGLFLLEGVDRVAHGPPVGPCQPVGEGLALEAPHVLGVEVLTQRGSTRSWSTRTMVALRTWKRRQRLSTTKRRYRHSRPR